LDTDCPTGLFLSWEDEQLEVIAMDGIKTILMVMVLVLLACSPEIGSKAWCESMKDKSKGDWTATEVKDFAKHCLLDLGE